MNLIFDFDGTLCDSLDESIIIANQFLSLIDKPHITAQQVRDRGMKQLWIDYKVPKAFLPAFMLYYRWQAAKRIQNMKAFPEIVTTIKKLSEKHTLGIVTSNSKANVESFLNHYKLKKYFKFIDSELSWVSKDKKVAKVIQKYSFDKKLTYYIGDETRDVQAMKRIGVKMIAVTWGIEDEKLLRINTPFKLISTPKELLKIF